MLNPDLNYRTKVVASHKNKLENKVGRTKNRFCTALFCQTTVQCNWLSIRLEYSTVGFTFAQVLQNIESNRYDSRIQTEIDLCSNTLLS